MTQHVSDSDNAQPVNAIMAASIAERQAEVLGEGPRIEPLDVSEISDDLLGIVQRMISVNQAINAREKSSLTELMSEDDPTQLADHAHAALAGLPEIIRTMLRHPQLFDRQTEMGIQLLGKGALSPRDRELAVLRIGWLCQAPYEWGEHVHVAKGVGISAEEIERITQGPQAPGWSEKDAAIVQAVDELHSRAMISDATWAVLSHYYNETQLIELPILIGQYQTVAYYQNSLRLRLHAGNKGLNAR